MDEFLNFNYSVDKQVESASRALSSIVTKMIKNGGFPYKVYKKLYNACVLSVSDSNSQVTGYNSYNSLQQLHLRAIRAFLGVPKTLVLLVSLVKWTCSYQIIGPN